MVLIHYCYCGHPRMPSKGEITENCRDLQIPKNQDFQKKKKKKHTAPSSKRTIQQYIKTSHKKLKNLTQEPQFLEVYATHSKEAMCANFFF